MSNYYKFPWHVEKPSFSDETWLNITSSSNQCIVQVFRPSTKYNEDEWKAITALVTLAPELMAVVRAVSKGKPCKEYQDLANSLVDAIEKEVDVPKSFWNNIDSLIEETEENSIEGVRDLVDIN